MKPRRILFVVNRAQSDGPQRAAIDTILPGVGVTISEQLMNPEAFDLVVLWFYRKILRNVDAYTNIVIFHASALPKGRGMAPIYYAFADDLQTCTVTAIHAANKLDSGDILGRAQFPVDPAMTAPALRSAIVDITLNMTAELLERDLRAGQKQEGQATYHALRTPAQNEVDLSCRLEDVMQHLRGCEPEHPAFTIYRGVKYFLTAVPAVPAADPVVRYEWVAPRHERAQGGDELLEGNNACDA